MRITANTSGIQDETWKEWVRRLKPNGVNLDGWRFTFRKTKRFKGSSGRCWPGKRLLVTVGTRQPKGIPYLRRGGGGYLPSVTYTLEESAMQTLAHELRHAWQFQNPRGRKVWGARGSTSERDADAWAIHAVRVERRRMGDELKSAACHS